MLSGGETAELWGHRASVPPGVAALPPAPMDPWTAQPSSGDRVSVHPLMCMLQVTHERVNRHMTCPCPLWGALPAAGAPCPL